MEYKYAFEKLEVWQNARSLVVDIYRITETFPDKERFGLTNQITIAAVSVSANLAEGITRISTKEQAHFTSIAYGSLIELLGHSILSCDLSYVDHQQLIELRAKIQPLSVKINTLRTKQLSFVSKLKTIIATLIL